MFFFYDETREETAERADDPARIRGAYKYGARRKKEKENEGKGEKRVSELEKEVFRAIEEAEMDEGDLKRILGIAEGVKLQRDRQEKEEKEKQRPA